MENLPEPLESDLFTVAYFISPHGFGHAARASAVIEAIQRINPNIHFHLFTSAPQWFFTESLKNHWTYHATLSDIGMVQRTALQEDVDETLSALRSFLPFTDEQIDPLVDQLKIHSCRLVLCDISPLGLAVAKRAGLSSVLIENFTWDWIYTGYPDRVTDFQPINDYLAQIFAASDFHIRSAPFCDATPADLVTSPVSRAPRNGREITRMKLGIPAEQKTVLVTMGGIPDRWNVDGLRQEYPEVQFLIPGGADDEMRLDNLIYLPHHHNYFHPDLVAASDAVIGKIGYSTISEVYWAGVPFAYVTRQGFRESAPLAAYIQTHIDGFELGQSAFENGDWQARVGELLKYPRVKRVGENGADQIARYLVNSGLLPI